MARPLAICRVCRRHVRATERICPFCAGSRALAAVALGTVVVAACGGTTEPGPVDAAPDVVDAAAFHDAGLDGFGFDALPDSTPDASASEGGVALYGAPPPNPWGRRPQKTGD